MNAARNPYAPSHATLHGGVAHDDLHVWRSGNVLVVARDSDLPERCVKCNEPADDPTKTRTVYWHHPGYYAFLLINIILYAIVAMIARKKASVSPGLCERHKRKRKIGIAVGWIGFFVGFLAMMVGSGSGGVALVLISILVMLASIIAGMILSRIVYARRIDDLYIYLKGCGEDFLASVPEFRPGTRNH